MANVDRFGKQDRQMKRELAKNIPRKLFRRRRSDGVLDPKTGEIKALSEAETTGKAS